MRNGFIAITLLTAMTAAAEMPVNRLVTSTSTPTADAPAFGTGSWFRKVFNSPSPRVELRPPVQLDAFVVDQRLELSLRNYIDLVLANNTDIQIERLSVELPRNNILRQYSIFDPTILASFQATRRETPANDALAGAATVSSLNQPLQVRVQSMLPTGTTWNFGFNGAKSSNNSAFQLYNPAINTDLAFGFTQPLLRNRGGMITKLPITVAQSRLRQTGYSIEDRILRIVAQAENAYWDVLLAREQLKVQESNLALNEEFLKRARRELELGAISELDIFQPEAQYKNAELQVTQARYRLQAVEDALRRQMGADLDPSVRTLPIILTEGVEPPVQTALDREELVEKALRQRPDLRAARQAIDIDDLTIRSTRNGLLPDLRLTGNYGSFGRGGPFYQRGNVFAGGGTGSPVISVIPGGLGDALDQLFGFGFPTYSMGLTLNFPLRDRRASADYADAVVNKRLDTLRVRNQEQTTRLEVLNSITQVEQSRASVELARVALDFAQKRLDAERKKFDLGTTTLFFVLEAQTQLNQRQTDLVNQTVNYRRNLTGLGRTTGDLLQERGIAVQ
jgi:outer membrane protein TolC